MSKDIKDLQAPQSPQEHPLFSGKQTVGMVSGQNPRFAAQASGHEQMGAALKQMGLKHEERAGKYGHPEKSYMVYGPTREQMFHLGNRFGQESVVFSQGGKHELLHTNGANTGKFHPALDHEWFKDEPEDYYTHMPEHGGFLRLNFDWNTLHPTTMAQPEAIQALEHRAATQKSEAQEIRFALAQTLRKAVAAALPVAPAKPHPHAYEWHNEHTDHHLQVVAPGVVLRHPGIAKAHPHMDGSKPPEAEPAHPSNDQAAGAGVSTYAKFALPYGSLDKTKPTDLLHYPYHGKNGDINKLVQDHGYNTYYAGGKYGRPDLANRNYNTKHLMIYDPSPSSGGDFGHEAYTDGWRKIHELSHALTYPELNETYGEGRRIGKLGQHRSTREALRAVHWEWLAAHKQRELSKQIGIHVPDHVFNKELNTVMHDAVHRAVTGKFTEPSSEGYKPHEHHIPLENALGMVREAGHNLGLTGMHDLIKKSEGNNDMADEKEHEFTESEFRSLLAKTIRDRVNAYSQEVLELRQRELKKSLGPVAPIALGPAPTMAAPTHTADRCLTCGQEDRPGSCMCLGAGAGIVKDEMDGSSDGVQMSESCSDMKKYIPAGYRYPPAPKAQPKPAEKPAAPAPVAKSDKTHVCKAPLCTKGIKGDTEYCKAHQSVPEKHQARIASEDSKMPKQMRDVMSPTKKGELSDKPKEPVKAADGNGAKIKKLPLTKATTPGAAPMPGGGGSSLKPPQAKAGSPSVGTAAKAPKPLGKAALPGTRPGDALQAAHAAGAAPVAPAPKVKLPGQADHAARAASFADFMPKPATTPKLPGMGGKPAAPPIGTAHLNAPPTLGKPAQPPAAPGAAPKLPGAAPAVKAPAPPPVAPPAPKLAKPVGKSDTAFDDLKKSLGNCALCTKPEHSGPCS